MSRSGPAHNVRVETINRQVLSWQVVNWYIMWGHMVKTKISREREVDETIRGYLSEQGIRYTGGRRAVVRALQIAGGPQSAAELHERLRRSIPLSSLYRSLAMLEEAGLLSLHRGQGKIARYELSEELSGHHHHLVCLECGAVADVELDPRAEKQLHDLADVAGRKAGYRVSGHSLEVEGLCSTCK